MAAISEDEAETANSSAAAAPNYLVDRVPSVVSMQLERSPSASSLKGLPLASQASMDAATAPKPSNAEGPSMRPSPQIVQSESVSGGAETSDEPRPKPASVASSFARAASSSTVPKDSKYSSNISSGRWTAPEHEAFLQGLKVYGREWRRVAACIPTRTSAQVRSHAQKYFVKVQKEQRLLAKQHRSLRPAGTKSTDVPRQNDQPMTDSFVGTMKSILSDPSTVESRVCQNLASLKERYKQLRDRLEQNKVPASVPSGAAPVGPATAALESEQKYLREAAVARYERKLERQMQALPSTAPSDPNGPSCARVCAHVSLASMPSDGGFASSDVIALSALGGTLGRDKVESKTMGTINKMSGLEPLRKRLRLVEHVHSRQPKVRKHE